jgi:hypothetical protein
MNDEYLRRAIRSMSSIGTISWFLMPNSTAVRTLKSSLERYLKTSTSSFILTFYRKNRCSERWWFAGRRCGGSSAAICFHLLLCCVCERDRVVLVSLLVGRVTGIGLSGLSINLSPSWHPMSCVTLFGLDCITKLLK